MSSIPVRHTFSKEEHLKSRSLIDSLFQKKQVISYGGLRMYWLCPEADTPSISPVLYGFATSKRSFPRAVDRNRIKRLMREAVRLQKGDWTFEQPIAFMFLYAGKEIPTYDKMFHAVKMVVGKWKSAH